MVVVGAGRVGGALQARAEAHGQPCALVTRTSGWDALTGGTAPILLAVRNDDLGPVVDRVAPERRGDLVFVQNGMLRPWLRGMGLGQATRGLLFLAVPSRGAPLEPGGVNPFHGPRASDVVDWFHAVDLPAEEVADAAFAGLELEKLVWNSAFGLLCQVHGADVGTVCEVHRHELTELVDELRIVASGEVGVELPLGPLVERLCAYSATIPRYRGAVKEWPWRNGWFVEEAARRGMRTPVHDRLLARIP